MKTLATEHSKNGQKEFTLPDWPFRFEVIDLDKMIIDDKYQRSLSKFVTKIQENFNPALIGTLIVSERKGKNKTSYAVIDGQTRREAMIRLNHRSAPCLVYTGLTRAQEAELFALFQTERRSIRPSVRFNAELAAGKTRAVEISNIVNGLGLSIVDVGGRAAGADGIGAIKALEDIWENYGSSTLLQVLEIIMDSWPNVKGRFTNELIRGMTYFIVNNRVETNRLIARLRTVDPRLLEQRAAALRSGRGLGGKSPSYMAEAIKAEYAKKGLPV